MSGFFWLPRNQSGVEVDVIRFRVGCGPGIAEEGEGF